MEYNYLNIILHFVVLFFAPPLFIGVINRIKAIIAGRTGQPLLQLYYDIFKLLKKDAVYSRSTTLVFQIAPIVILVSIIISGTLLPLGGMSVINFQGDIILFVYFLAFVRFMMIIAAMDTASSFEGMGASREATFGAFAELTVFTVLVTLTVVARSFEMSEIVKWKGSPLLGEPALILAFLSFFFVLLVENSRMPIDDPNTHLELTMIHEVMILDYSGPDLGIMLYGASMKIFIFMALTAMIVFPAGAAENLFLSSGILLLKVLGISVVIGIIESVSARIRLIRIPQMLIASFVLALFGLLISLYGRGQL